MTKEEPARPIPECYWVIPGRLLAGEYPGARLESQAEKKLRAFLGAGIRSFIDLTQPGELDPYDGLLSALSAELGLEAVYERRTIQDLDVPEPEVMRGILDAIEKNLAATKPLYVHCWGGIGRTGTVIGCYFVEQGMTGEGALEKLAAHWQTVPKSSYYINSPQTEDQRSYVRDWKRKGESG